MICKNPSSSSFCWMLTRLFTATATLTTFDRPLSVQLGQLLALGLNLHKVLYTTILKYPTSVPTSRSYSSDYYDCSLFPLDVRRQAINYLSTTHHRPSSTYSTLTRLHLTYLLSRHFKIISQLRVEIAKFPWIALGAGLSMYSATPFIIPLRVMHCGSLQVINCHSSSSQVLEVELDVKR
ncbi:hypothetical protein CPB83DRAFT_521139 [Crepidotus variabilis]|uniref:Uncharacterized protein n=1 Tax=Crepidotus variabilis TaxID=179855 RepID=A0A9P6EB84_9AGAR|nr:hypothetical protein CPB83DRAFT_521139 [Crepidotus variabilis]